MNRRMTVKFTKNLATGFFRFRLYSSNGRVLVSSEDYNRLAKATAVWRGIVKGIGGQKVSTVFDLEP
jgi:uncharacterized protein YegP (UPF0339 family)